MVVEAAVVEAAQVDTRLQEAAVVVDDHCRLAESLMVMERARRHRGHHAHRAVCGAYP